MRIRRLFLATGCILGLASAARGDLFWKTWEGNHYPEQEFWQRYTRGGGAQRTLGDGLMTLDGMASGAIVDEYLWFQPVVLDPMEYLRVDWRVRIDDEAGPLGDAGIVLDVGNQSVALTYTENAIYSEFEGWIGTFAPGVFHTYSLTSRNLSGYDLRVDGQLVFTGCLVALPDDSGLCWGDLCEGDASRSTWDYVRWGVLSGFTPLYNGHVIRDCEIRSGTVPEPSADLLLGSASLALFLSLARKLRRCTGAHRPTISSASGSAS
jgi:hypothetical protein